MCAALSCSIWMAHCALATPPVKPGVNFETPSWSPCSQAGHVTAHAIQSDSVEKCNFVSNTNLQPCLEIWLHEASNSVFSKQPCSLALGHEKSKTSDWGSFKLLICQSEPCSGRALAGDATYFENGTPSVFVTTIACICPQMVMWWKGPTPRPRSHQIQHYRLNVWSCSVKMACIFKSK